MYKRRRYRLVTSCPRIRLFVTPMIRVLLVAALVSTAWAQMTVRGSRPGGRGPEGEARQDSRTATAGEPGLVRGTVVGAGNEPLRKAEVVLRAGRGGGTTMVRTTDANGSFVFEGVPPGNYTLSAQRTGYVRSEYGAKPGVRGAGPTIPVGAGQQVTGITVKLLPQAVIAGKVVDEEGDPVMHVAVQVLKERWINGRRQLVPMNADSTNDLGEYRIAELAPGRYYLLANTRSGWEAQARAPSPAGDLTYPATYYPGVQEASQATPIEVAAGQQALGIDFRLRKLPAFRIRGKVIDEAGKPAQFAAVTAIPSDAGLVGPRGMAMVRGADGAFELANILPGPYTLVVNRMNREERSRMTGQASVQVGNRDLEGVVIQLARPFEVTGFVKLPNEAAIPENLRVVLEPMHTGAPFFGGTESQMKDGEFTISGISPGKYRFTVQNLPPGTYLKSVMVQGQDLTAGASIMAAATGVEVTLGMNAPQVTGVVLNGEKQPVAGATVALVPESSKFERYWLFRTATTDQNGAFTVNNIVPGQYTAYAFTDVEEGSWHSREFLQPFEGKGVAVKLAEGAKENVQLTAVQ